MDNTMNIPATLQNCANALGGMQLRVDQEQQHGVTKSVIITLLQIKEELLHREAEAQAHAQAAEPPQAPEDPEEELLDALGAPEEE